MYIKSDEAISDFLELREKLKKTLTEAALKDMNLYIFKHFEVKVGYFAELYEKVGA